MRPDFGEFQIPDHPEPNWYARNLFLKTVQQLAPGVLADLKRLALPLYHELPGELRQRPHFMNMDLHNGWVGLTEAAAGEGSLSNLVNLIRVICQWAAGFHLADDWVKNRALGTLFYWYEGGRANTWQGVNWSGGHSLHLDSSRFDFSVGGWDPTMHTRLNYEKGIIEAFKSRLTGYLDSREADAEERGWTRTKQWRLHGGSLEQRFRPLVRWQVQEWTLVRIKNELGSSIRAVQTTLNNLAMEIGLARRPGRRGRPRRPSLP